MKMHKASVDTNSCTLPSQLCNSDTHPLWLYHMLPPLQAVRQWCTHLQIDEQDAEERAELRRKQIEAANKMLYDDTDRPKKLHSKMLLSDVMQERVAQMGYAQQIKALKHNQDTAFLVQQAARLKVMRPSYTTAMAFIQPNYMSARC